MPSESADRHPVEKNMVDAALAFDASRADLNPIALGASLSSERLCRVLPSEGIGGVGCWFLGHLSVVSTLTGAWKDAVAG